MRGRGTAWTLAKAPHIRAKRDMCALARRSDSSRVREIDGSKAKVEMMKHINWKHRHLSSCLFCFIVIFYARDLLPHSKETGKKCGGRELRRFALLFPLSFYLHFLLKVFYSRIGRDARKEYAATPTTFCFVCGFRLQFFPAAKTYIIRFITVIESVWKVCPRPVRRAPISAA